MKSKYMEIINIYIYTLKTTKHYAENEQELHEIEGQIELLNSLKEQFDEVKE